MNGSDTPCIAIAGNPNTGKSSVFNALTGLRQQVANYPGVTVEEKTGVMALPGTGPLQVIDLPGAYSLNPRSPDEEIARDVILGQRTDTARPAVVVVVVDASSLERNLFLVSQLLGAGTPVVVALNMMDVAEAAGCRIDVPALSRHLGVPVIPMNASRRIGVAELKHAVERQLREPSLPRDPVPLAPDVLEKVDALAGELETHLLVAAPAARGEALRLIVSEQGLDRARYALTAGHVRPLVESARRALTAAGQAWYAAEAEARYRWIEEVMAEVRDVRATMPSAGEVLDRILTHRVGGPVALLAVMLFVFYAMSEFSRPAMDLIKHGFDAAAALVAGIMPAGALRDLITEGVLSGVGSVLVFLPQILLLFLMIAVLEDSGYMARVAFIMDRLMGRAGLPGRAFIPLLSSFACAIPGIMGSRTIENTRDRLATILVSPLICCSARWPVYLLIAGTVFPDTRVFGFLPLPAAVILGMVVLGLAAAVVAARVLRGTLLRGQPSVAVLELPKYRLPRLGTVLHAMWERGWLFVRKAGTIILAMSVILWALSTYPALPGAPPEQQMRHSIAGRVGRAIEPVIAPLGFDWRIGVSILSSFAAREVFVSAMGTIYGVDVKDPHKTADLQARLRGQLDPETGRPFFTPLRGVSLMVFFVLAMQCLSTLVVVRRETNGWRWPLFQWAYMTGLAWVCCFVIWQGGRLLGWG